MQANQKLKQKSGILSELSRFGLNPKDWDVESLTQQQDPMVILKNLKDHHFQLIGRVDLQVKTPQLHELQIFSI